MSNERPEPQRLTEADGRRSLREHAIERALIARDRHGPTIDAAAFVRLLGDRSVVRYPVEMRFDATPLESGEFAWARPRTDHPAGGFELFVHPRFGDQASLWPLLAAYHLPAINYGDIAEPGDCEAFGAALFGLEVDAYYAMLCSASDAVR